MYGIIGFPLSHSFSPNYFNNKFKTLGKEETYSAFPLKSICELPYLIKNHPELKGLNITIPYKETVLPYLLELDEIAQKIGAVNCIKIIEGKLFGYNTDVIGFLESLKPYLSNDFEKALVLGSGGASKAVVYALKTIGIIAQIVSRKPLKGQLKYTDLTKEVIEKHKLIVNTTPLGMFPNNNACPEIPYSFLTNAHLLYDVIYNPEISLFLQKGQALGTKIMNGHQMLIMQAEAAWRIWQKSSIL